VQVRLDNLEMKNMKLKVLIVDDNPDFTETIADIVQSFGYNTISKNTPNEALVYLEKNHLDIGIILLDIEFATGERMNGLDLLEIIRRNYLNIPVVMISGKGTIESAVQATKLGASNFIEKSIITKDKIKSVLDSSIRSISANTEQNEILKFLASVGLIGKSKKLVEIGDSIIRYGRTDLNVLITGETGTGKKLVAKALHSVSRRAKYPFITVDIPNIPKELFQSELFGHTRGSFSGATETKKGLFQEANKGTMFLDEIGDLSPELQSNLFIPIEEKIVRKVGSLQNEEVDIRFISATDKDLIAAMRESKFREQLYHRLRECEIHLPSLADRCNDIPDIIAYYCQKHNFEFNEMKYFADSTIQLLSARQWGGNVRELASFIRVALQTSQREKIETIDVQKILNNSNSQTSNISQTFISPDRTLKEDLAEVDKQKIEATLTQCNGNVSKSAAMLGVSRETLHNKIRRYDINVHSFRKKV